MGQQEVTQGIVELLLGFEIGRCPTPSMPPRVAGCRPHKPLGIACLRRSRRRAYLRLTSPMR